MPRRPKLPQLLRRLRVPLLLRRLRLLLLLRGLKLLLPLRGLLQRLLSPLPQLPTFSLTMETI